MEFYQSVLGGELSVSTFADVGGMGMPEGDQQLVMHAQLTGPDGRLVLMGADTPSGMEHTPVAGFSVSLSGGDHALLHEWWEGLADGATITMPLEAAPWGDAFGMLTDRFGIPWLFNIAGVAADEG